MAKSVGNNVSYEVNAKNHLVITVDLNKKGEDSKSGKTIVIGSSQGNTKITDAKDKEVIFGLNVYKYPDGGKKKSKKEAADEEDSE